jgi:hypothetical protein
MQTNLKARCLEFLYGQLSKGNLSQIRKGMAEELEAFVEEIRADDQAKRISERVQGQQQAQASKELITALDKLDESN